MKRFLAAFLTLALLLTGLTLTASAATTGWVKDGDNWTYVKADGKLAENEWIQDGGKWYYFDGTVMVADGICEVNKKFYAFGKNGAMVANGWFEQKYDEGGNSDWYYAGADGALVDGWKYIGKNWYYFSGSWTDETTGETYTWPPYMAKGWWTIKDVDYAFKSSGEMIVGWGQPWLQWEDDDWVYANADGSLAEGWKKIDGKWYYLTPVMIEDTITGFKDGKPWHWGEGCTYYAFNKSGAMIENGWYKDEYTWEDDEGNTGTGHDWYYLGKDGAAQKGWIKDGGKWYYLDATYAQMYDDRYGLVEMNDGKTYTFKKSGEMVTGWYQIDDTWYFFNDSGAMVEKDWVKSGSKWYYLKEGGAMAKDETLTIGGKEYKFDKDGAWIEK